MSTNHPSERLDGLIAKWRKLAAELNHCDPLSWTAKIHASGLLSCADQLEAVVAALVQSSLQQQEQKEDTRVDTKADANDSPTASTVEPESTGWQPIATAPKDGTAVLLWWRDERWSDDGVKYWACGFWREYGDGSKGWVGESFHASEPDCWTRLVCEQPTHWMPLPEPPQPADAVGQRSNDGRVTTRESSCSCGGQSSPPVRKADA